MKKYMGVWLLILLLLSLAACGGSREGTETTVAPDPEGLTVTYYHGAGRGSKLIEESVQIPKLTAQGILDLMIREEILPENTKIRNFRLSQGVITLDLSAAFEEGIQGLSKSGERVMMGSLVNTFLTVYEAEGLDLTIEGRVLKTTRHIYDDTLRFYD